SRAASRCRGRSHERVDRQPRIAYARVVSRYSSVTREYTSEVQASARLVAVHLTLALAGSACNSLSPAPPERTTPADLVIVNGRVYTGDDSGTVADAVAVSGNVIFRVGKADEIGA